MSVRCCLEHCQRLAVPGLEVKTTRIPEDLGLQKPSIMDFGRSFFMQQLGKFAPLKRRTLFRYSKGRERRFASTPCALLICNSGIKAIVRFWMLHNRHHSSLVESDAHCCCYHSGDDAVKNLAAVFLEKSKGCPPALNALLVLNDLFQPRRDSLIGTQPSNHAIKITTT